jgi:protein-disulfide isomerase
MPIDRRHLLRLAAAAAFSGLADGRARADEGLFPLHADDGAPMPNFRVPSDIPIDGLPGLVVAGARDPDVVLTEFFDYNCPFCRAAVGSIDALLKADRGLRLVLVNNPILSRGSLAAAQVQQAVLRIGGPGQAYAFHKAALERRGVMDGISALAVAADLGLDREVLAKGAELPQVSDALSRQAESAKELGFETTPSFVLGSTAIVGYPGPGSLHAAIAATRACDRPMCDSRG